MPVLSNPKHEKFAQELAKGKGQAEAYEAAGYEPSEPNASRLTRNDKIQTRVAELMGSVADAIVEAAVLTVQTGTKDLMRLARKAEALGTAPGIAAAKSCIVDALTLNGHYVTKSEVMRTTVDLTEAELERRIRQLDAAETGDHRSEAGTAGAHGRASQTETAH